jgi:hypothetical protein
LRRPLGSMLHIGSNIGSIFILLLQILGGFIMSITSQKTVRKYSRCSTSRKKLDPNQLTLTQMFEKFMIFKATEGLTEITLNDYKKHSSIFWNIRMGT